MQRGKVKNFCFFKHFEKLPLILFFCYTSVSGQTELTLEDIWKNKTYRQKSVQGWESSADGKTFTRLEQASGYSWIGRYDILSGKLVDTVLTSRTLKDSEGKSIDIDSYQYSADEKQMMILSKTESIFRHSTKSAVFVVDLPGMKVSAVRNGEKIRLAALSPNGKRVGYVSENNLHAYDLETGKTTIISRDGKTNEVINGACDWVYEEEFGFDQAWFWSPDGNYIAYYRFDETQVREFEMPLYGTLYPGKSVFKYPKAGEKNSEVNILVYDFSSNKNKVIDTGKETDQYIPRIAWAGNQLAVLRLNRLQNKLDFLICDPAGGSSRILFSESSDAYIDITDNWYMLSDGKSMVWSSEQSGFRHLYLKDLLTGANKATLTSGSYEVMTLNAVDEANNLIYFSSNEEQPLAADLYVVSLDGKNKKRLTKTQGSHRVILSNDFSHYIDYHSSANVPLQVGLYKSDGNLIRMLEENTELKEKLKALNLSPKEFMKIKTASGVELNGWMIKPGNFDAKKKYPVLVAIYGGPGHNTVVDQYEDNGYLWHQLLAQKGYLVFSVDNRGTLNRGTAFRNATYGRLGELETQDQIEAARYLADLPYVDGKRIGIQGWSFGGYLSSLCISKGADVFKAAIAVAPVTNWRYYDSIYTERFLKTPQENPTGYDENSPINFTGLIKGKYLLIHGTADDNVHFQNSVEMVTSLVKNGVDFEFMMYPDKNHGIGGGQTRLHLYKKMTDFITTNL